MAERVSHETEDAPQGRSSTAQADPAAGPEAVPSEDAHAPGTEEDGRRWAANWRTKEIRWLHTRVGELEQRLRRRTIALGISLAVGALLAVAVVSLAAALWYGPGPPIATAPEAAPPVAETPPAPAAETPPVARAPAGPRPEPAVAGDTPDEPAPDVGRPQEAAAEASPMAGPEEPEGPPAETASGPVEGAPDGEPATREVLDALNEMNERMTQEIERLEREIGSR